MATRAMIDESTMDDYPEGPLGVTRDELVPIVAKLLERLAQAERDEPAYQEADHERLINARFYASELMRELASIGNVEE